MSAVHSHPLESYHVGILCALSIEQAAVAAVLDEEHGRPIGLSARDSTSYVFGRAGKHHVVVACLPAGRIGKASAATAAAQVSTSFALKVALMVGIGGGVPSKSNDIRLGDVVVSQPCNGQGGVTQWDFGKVESQGFRATGHLDKPPRALLDALSSVKTRHERPKRNFVKTHLLRTIGEMDDERWEYQGLKNDVLFEANYDHVSGSDTACDDEQSSTQCDQSKCVQRKPRKDPEKPVIHYGTIASGDAVMKNGRERDRIAKSFGALCFEMEAAGLEDNFPCIVIRGICDYSDSHKHKNWQRYSAASAAAFARELLEDIAPQTLEMAETYSREARNYQVPFSLEGMPCTDKFVEREAEMAQLRIFFLSQPAVRRRVLAVDGLGGIGKTQLCVNFVRTHRQHFASVLWLDGSTKDSLEQSLEQCAERIFTNSLMPTRNARLSLPSSNDIEPEDTAVSRFLSWLADEGNDQWLMIIDNLDRDWPNDADPYAYDYKRYIPKTDQGNILITTRLSTLRTERLRLGRTNDDQALQMLALHANRNFTMDEARPVLKRLDGLPLALVQAGAYLGNHPSIAEYCAEYERKWSQLMDMQGSTMEEHDSILTTWTMSRDQVQSRAPNAAGLLRIWAFLDHRDIWYGLVDSAWYAGLDSALEEWYYDLTNDEASFRKAIDTLLAYSLIEVTDGQGWSMHPVLHAWNLHDCMNRPDRIVLYRMALASVAGMSTDQALGERLLPHAQSLAKHDFLVCEYYAALHLGSIANILALHIQDPLDSQRLYEHALALRRTRLSPGHKWTLETLMRLGQVYCAQSNFKRADCVLREALQASDNEMGRNNIYNIGILALLGRVAQDLDQYEISETWYLQGLNVCSYVLGYGHYGTSAFHDDLGGVYRSQARLTQSENHYRQAIDGLERSLGRHRVTDDSVYHLGSLYEQCKRYGEAESHYLRALHGRYQDFGVGFRLTLLTMRSLGNVYMEQEKFQVAESLYKDAKCRAMIKFGSSDSSTTFIVGELGTLYQRWQLWTKAEAMHRQAIRGQLNSVGKWHEDTLESVRNMALLFSVQGMLKRAKTLLKRCAERYEKVLGHANEDALDSIRFQIEVIEDRMFWCRRHGISEDLLRIVLARMQLRLTEQNWEIVQQELLKTPSRLREAELQRLDDCSDESDDGEYHFDLSDDSDGEPRTVHIYGRQQGQGYGDKDATRSSNKQHTYIYARPRLPDDKKPKATIELLAEEDTVQGELTPSKKARAKDTADERAGPTSRQQSPSGRNEIRHLVKTPLNTSILPKTWTGPTVEEVSDEESNPPYNTSSVTYRSYIGDEDDGKSTPGGAPDHDTVERSQTAPSERNRSDARPQPYAPTKITDAPETHTAGEVHTCETELESEPETKRRDDEVSYEQDALEECGNSTPPPALPSQIDDGEIAALLASDKAEDDCESASTPWKYLVSGAEFEPLTKTAHPISSGNLAHQAVADELSIAGEADSEVSHQRPESVQAVDACHEKCDSATENVIRKAGVLDQEKPPQAARKDIGKRKKQSNIGRHKKSLHPSRRHPRATTQCCLQ